MSAVQPPPKLQSYNLQSYKSYNPESVASFVSLRLIFPIQNSEITYSPLSYYIENKNQKDYYYKKKLKLIRLIKNQIK